MYSSMRLALEGRKEELEKRRKEVREEQSQRLKMRKSEELCGEGERRLRQVRHP